MRARLARPLAAAAVVVAAATGLHAALPTFWQVSTEAEFLRGDIENLAVDSYGRLTLGPSSATLYEATAPFLWTVVAAPDGSVFVGSGNEGQVFRIAPDGEASVFFDAEELEVHAIAIAPGGGIYAATSPAGRIYRVDAQGTATVLFDPPDAYIWSLAVDQAGTVFAGTGDKGVIYRITPDGQGEVFYETRASHAMALAFDRDGRLVAGTESPGRVFRIDAAGRPFVLLDSPYSEIRALRVDDEGSIWVAAVNGRGASAPAPAQQPPAPDPPPQPTASVSTEITVVAVDPDAGQAQGAPPAQGGGQGNQAQGAGAIFRILPDGGWDQVWQLRDDAPYDIAVDGDSLLVATGNEGRIYRLAGEPMLPTLVTRATAQQVTTLLADSRGQVLYTTSNPGKVYRLAETRAAAGTYTSDVRDAVTVATWGAIKWQATSPQGTSVALSTRSGNTATPDETWSEWTDPYRDAEGSQITSPRARYLQWRAVLTGSGEASPVLTSVTAAYLPRNTRPRVTSITVHPPGTVFQQPFPTEPPIAGFEGNTPEQRAAQTSTGGGQPTQPTLGRRVYERGLLTFVWRAEDENGDDLMYTVNYRREGETTWRELRGGLVEPILVWDTTSVPNGRYVVQIAASDARSNSPDTALTGMLESSTFEIDNTPPEVTVTGVQRDGGRTIVAFEVRDEHSAVQKAEYSLDGDRWQTIYPRDGIADSRVEEFEVVLEDDEAVREVIVRAADMLNNVTSARAQDPAAAPVPR